MEKRTRQQRADDAVSGLRRLTAEEEARLKVVTVPVLLVSLVLQGLSLVVAVRTVREIYRARHLGLGPVVRATSGSLLDLLLLALAQNAINRRMRAWIRRLLAAPSR